MITLKITKIHNNIVVSIHENGQYIDTRVFHYTEQRDLLKYMYRIIKQVMRA